MTKQYIASLQKGEEYQDFLMRELIQYGFIIMPYSSQKYQYAHGESYTGHEIKFDDRMKDTGNIYIEVAERRNEQGSFVNSGVKKDDNTLHFIIGNYQEVFIFQKKILKLICNDPKFVVRRVETATSQGILLDKEKMKGFTIHIDLKEKIIK